MKKTRSFLMFMCSAALFMLILSLIGGERLSLSAILDSGTAEHDIFMNLRLPRTLFAFVTGAILSVGGLIFQSVFKNDLASPFTLGIASGASFGTLLAVQLGLIWQFPHLKLLFSFSGAVLSVLLVAAVSRAGGGRDLNTLLLAGVSINFLFSAMILFLQYLFNPNDLGYAVRWMMGNIETYGFSELLSLLPVFILIVAFSVLFSRHMDILRMGDDFSAAKGIHGPGARMFLFVVASLLIAGAVSYSGPVGFVGLIVPHMVKIMFGGNHARLTLYSALAGGVFLAFADTAARTMLYPAEMPVGIVTSMVGVPFFLVKLMKNRR